MKLSTIANGFRRDRKNRGSSINKKSSASRYPETIQSTLDAIHEIDGDEERREKIDDACQMSLRLSYQDLRDKILRRVAILDRCLDDKAFREETIAQVSQDPVAFFNMLVWTQDPRLLPGPTNIPFDLFPAQEGYVRWRVERRQSQENGIVVKSRDMGLTWMNSGCHVHSWIFETGYKGALGSRKEDLVDKLGDMDSIFEKVRFIIKCLPEWLVPKHNPGFLKIINYENGSALTGEAGDNIGRGGRNSVYDIDEAEFLERGQRVDAALSENCRVIFWTSTVNIWNPGNFMRSKRRKGTIPVFRFNWKDDPRKDAAWYQQRVDTLDALIIASEIDMNEDAASPDAVIPPVWLRTAMDRWQDRSQYGVDVLGVDVARGGADKTVIARRYMFWIDKLLVYPGQDTPDGDIVGKLIEEAMTGPATAINIDIVGVGSSPYDWLKRKGYQNLRGINGGSMAIDSFGEPLRDRTGEMGFYDMNAYMWWHLRELLDPKYGDFVELPPDDNLFAALTCRNYAPVPLKKPIEGLRGLYRVESKKDIKKRLGRSPDEGDAVVYAFAEVENDTDSDADWLINSAFPQYASWNS